jgi:hypothetical protein
MEPSARRTSPADQESSLDLLAARAAGEAVNHLDPFVGTVGTLDRLFEDGL